MRAEASLPAPARSSQVFRLQSFPPDYLIDGAQVCHCHRIHSQGKNFINDLWRSGHSFLEELGEIGRYRRWDSAHALA